MATYVIEVTDLKYEVRLDLRGCLEAVVASEAAIRLYINNIHMDMQEIGSPILNLLIDFACDARL